MLTAEEKEERRQRIGASDVAAILGFSEFKSPYEIWAEKTGRLEDDTDTDETRLGHYLEPGILSAAEESLGPLRRNVVIEAEGLGFPLASRLDGQLVDSGEPVEAKTWGLCNDFAKSDVWGMPGSDEVPIEYMVQLTAQVTCTKTQAAHLWALVRGRGLQDYLVMVPKTIRAQVLDRLGEFWNDNVIKDTPPEIDHVPVSLECAKRLKVEAGKTCELPKVALDEWNQLQRWRDSVRISQEARDRFQARILVRLGDAEAGLLPDGTWLHNKEQTRKAHQVAESTFRVLRRKR